MPRSRRATGEGPVQLLCTRRSFAVALLLIVSWSAPNAFASVPGAKAVARGKISANARRHHDVPQRAGSINRGAGAAGGSSRLGSVAAAAAVPSAESHTGGWIIRLKAQPAATNTGGIAGFAATAAMPSSGAVGEVSAAAAPGISSRLQPASAAFRAFTTFINRQSTTIAQQVLGSSSKIIHNYNTAFAGFSTGALTPAELQALRQDRRVEAVFPDEQVKLLTLSTPSFLGLDAQTGLWAQIQAGTGNPGAGEDIVIGVIDSGYDPSSPSFSDRLDPFDPNSASAYGPPPSHFNNGGGLACQAGTNVNATCNNKVVRCAFFNQGLLADVGPLPAGEEDSCRDMLGHGSHTASTAGGNSLVFESGARLTGLAPRARIAVYKVFWGPGGEGGRSSDVIAAIEQATLDNVDVINYSIADSTQEGTLSTPVLLAFKGAAAAGIFVAAGGGNMGEYGAYTVTNNAPWLTSVAASTHSRSATCPATLRLGDGQSFEGISGFLGGSLTNASTPLVLATDAGAAGVDASAVAECRFGSLDSAAVSGKIVVCKPALDFERALQQAAAEAQRAGAVGVVMLWDVYPYLKYYAAYALPGVQLADSSAQTAVKQYAGGGAGTATIATGNCSFDVEAPEVASFSSKGPVASVDTGMDLDMLKPDITAPGVRVVAAWALPGQPVPTFIEASGTSMAAPHIAGVAALLKQLHPSWTPMMIKSAMMTTAFQKTQTGPSAGQGWIGEGIFAYGAGHIDPQAASNPGLVLDAGLQAWDNTLCASGHYNKSDWSTKCPVCVSDAAACSLANLNQPSIVLSNLPLDGAVVTRTVTSVLSATATFSATVVDDLQVGLLDAYDVSVSPSTFTIAPGASQALKVSVKLGSSAAATPTDYMAGAIILSSTSPTASVRLLLALRPEKCSLSDLPAGVNIKRPGICENLFYIAVGTTCTAWCPDGTWSPTNQDADLPAFMCVAGAWKATSQGNCVPLFNDDVHTEPCAAANISAGGSHLLLQMAVHTTTARPGSVKGLGLNQDGQLGDGTTRNSLTWPTDMAAGATGLHSAAGLYHSCVVAATGRLLCTGKNENSQAGQDPTSNPTLLTLTPVAGLPLTPDSRVADICAGGFHTCVLLAGGAADGEVWCFGYGGLGATGSATYQSSHVPSKVAGLPSKASAIACGHYHTCVIVGEGASQSQVYCFGYNEYGQLGSDTSYWSAQPLLVAPLSSAKQLALGDSFSCALVQGGQVQCWGDNRKNQLCRGDVQYESDPNPAPAVFAEGVKQIAAGDFHLLALTESGTVQGCGYNNVLQLGVTCGSLFCPSPVTVTGLPSGVVQVAAGQYFSAVRDTSNNVRVWGPWDDKNSSFWDEDQAAVIVAAQKSQPVMCVVQDTKRCTYEGLAALPSIINAQPFAANCANTSYKLAQTCTAVCKPSFTPVGSLAAVCSDQGTWLPATGSCSAAPGASCNVSSLPPPPAFGKPYDCNTTLAQLSDGASCTTTCADGYTATGPLSVVCNSGKLRASNGTCVEQGCAANPDISIVGGSWACVALGAVQSGAACTAVCANPVPGNASRPSVECRKGQWVMSSGSGSCEGSSGVYFMTFTAGAGPARLLAPEEQQLLRQAIADTLQQLTTGTPGQGSFSAGNQQLQQSIRDGAAATTARPLTLPAGQEKKHATGKSGRKQQGGRRHLQQDQQLATAAAAAPSSSVLVVGVAFLPAAAATGLPDSNTLDKLFADKAFVDQLASRLAASSFQRTTGFATVASSDSAGGVTGSRARIVDCRALLQLVASVTPSGCSGASTLDVTFDLSTVGSALLVKSMSFEATSEGAVCNATRTFVGPTSDYRAVISMSCLKTVGGFAPGTSTVSLKATYTGEGACQGSQTTGQATVVMPALPAVTVTAAPVSSVCASSAQVKAEFDYQVTGATKDVLLEFQATSPGANCTVQQAGKSTTAAGKVVVVCGRQQQPSTAAQVTLLVKARPGGQAGCTAGQGSSSVAVPVICCIDGAAAAASSNTSQCLQALQPGTLINQCKKASLVPVFINRGSGDATLWVQTTSGAGNSCQEQVSVGSVSVSCDDAFNKIVRFTLTNDAGSSYSRRMFLLACNQPSAVSAAACPSQLAWKPLPQSASITTDAATVTTSFSVTMTGRAGVCGCSQVFWSVIDVGTFSGAC